MASTSASVLFLFFCSSERMIVSFISKIILPVPLMMVSTYCCWVMMKRFEGTVDCWSSKQAYYNVYKNTDWLFGVLRSLPWLPVSTFTPHHVTSLIITANAPIVFMFQEQKRKYCDVIIEPQSLQKLTWMKGSWSERQPPLQPSNRCKPIGDHVIKATNYWHWARLKI